MLNYPVCYYDPQELSPRETEVLAEVYKGKEVNEIAEALFVAPCTIRTHLQRIFDKTNIRSRQKLMAQKIMELEDKLKNGFTGETN